jgi:hypothetical protein
MSQSSSGWETGGQLKPALTALLLLAVVAALSLAIL